MLIKVDIYHNETHSNFRGFDPKVDFLLYVASEEVEINLLHFGSELTRVAEQIFAEWNSGSGQESEKFLSMNCRSLSVGDVLVFPEAETSLACASFGWDVVTPDPDFMFRKVA